MSRLDGKIAVVTGGTQGLGAEVARLFAERGAAGLVICGRSVAKGEAKAEEIAARYGTQVHFVAADLAQVMVRAGKARNGLLLQGLMREMGLPDAEGKEVQQSPVRIHAKSGTLNFVSNLAGYVSAPTGDLAFAVIAADPPRRAAVPMDEREDPKGGTGWTRRARRLHKLLIRAWAARYL